MRPGFDSRLMHFYTECEYRRSFCTLYPILTSVSIPKRLRGETRNLMCSARAGSSPAGYAFLFFPNTCFKFSILLEGNPNSDRQPLRWPSGLRRYVQVVVSPGAWVRTPPSALTVFVENAEYILPSTQSTQHFHLVRRTH